MAKRPASGIRTYFDHYDISGDVDNTQLKIEQENARAGGLSVTGPRRIVSNYDFSNSHMAFFESTDEGSDEQFFAALQTAVDHYLVQCFAGDAEGALAAYLSIVEVTGEPRQAQAGNAQMVGFETAGSGGLIRGVVLANATVTGAGNRTGRNQGATTLGQTYGVLFVVLAFTGTNITIKLQSSTDDAVGDAYADIAGLTSGALTAIGHVYASTTAATEAWKRVAISGTFTSALVLVVGGRVLGS